MKRAQANRLRDAEVAVAAVEKLHVNEIRPSGEVSTVGLFYSRNETDLRTRL